MFDHFLRLALNALTPFLMRKYDFNKVVMIRQVPENVSTMNRCLLYNMSTMYSFVLCISRYFISLYCMIKLPIIFYLFIA